MEGGAFSDRIRELALRPSEALKKDPGKKSKHGTHPRKLLPDGTPNPDWKPRKGGKSGDEHNRFQHAKFIMVDGEGVTYHWPEQPPYVVPDGRTAPLDDEGKPLSSGAHDYILLGNSEGETISSLDPGGLSTEACLEFLIHTGKLDRRAIVFSYVHSYDVTKWLRDIDADTWRRLREHKQTEPPVRWKGKKLTHSWGLIYTPRKEFRVIKYLPGVPYKDCPRVTVWDVFGFFQRSFVKAIEEWFPEHPLLQEIAEGKAGRSTFKPEELPDITAYMQRELQAGVQLMEALHAALVEAGVQLTRWDGAGAIAAYLLKSHKVKEAKGTCAVQDDRKEELDIAIRSAYSGGRIEVFRYGFWSAQRNGKKVHHADIRSAYPAAMVKLPALTGGSWQHRFYCEPEVFPGTSGTKQGVLRQQPWPVDFRPMYSLSLVQWDLQNRSELFPFFVREHGGHIVYPRRGMGWHWEPEIRAAQAALERGELQGTINILETWAFYEADPTYKPFAWVEELYKQRAAWKKAGRAAQFILKYGINALYGKLAQQKGWHFKEDGQLKLPPYFDLGWAGFITAHTRAQLYEASIGSAEGIICFQTDGIFSTEPLALDEGNGLGQWEADEVDSILVAQAGVYWVDVDEKTGTVEEGNEYRRGYDRGSISAGMVLDAYAKLERVVMAHSTRFLTAGSALGSSRLYAALGSWRTIDRELNLGTEGNSKRVERMHVNWRKTKAPRYGLIPTDAADAYESVQLLRPSLPYSLEWVVELDDGVDTRVIEREEEDSDMAHSLGLKS